jgi:hypothetical protein
MEANDMVKNVLLVASCLVPVTTLASAQVLELEGRYWPAALTATVRVTGDHAEVPSDISTINLKSDLGLKDKNLKDFRLTLLTGPNSRLRMAYVKMDYSADQNIMRTILFNGQMYTVGTRVLTTLNLDYWRYGWVWEFVGGPSSKVKFGTLLEAKKISVDAALSAPEFAPEFAPPVEEKKSFSATVPTVGLVLDINPSRMLNIFAEVSGMSLGDKGHAWDGEAGLKLVLGSHLVVSGGYRYFDLQVNDKPDFATLKNSGPFVGAGLRL